MRSVALASCQCIAGASEPIRARGGSNVPFHSGQNFTQRFHSSQASSSVSSDPDTKHTATTTGAPIGAAGALGEYLIDAAQRGVLFFDVMRERGNSYRAQSGNSSNTFAYDWTILRVRKDHRKKATYSRSYLDLKRSTKPFRLSIQDIFLM